jgi:pyridoxine 5-phosphate synthase
MLKLGVNIDHVATLRQARGTPYPDIIKAASLCETAGADGITVHLREDRRHIQDDDVHQLRRHLTTRLNLEMAIASEIVNIAKDIGPDEVCLVPEKREERTTEAGLDVDGQYDEVERAVTTLAESGVTVSLFIDPEISQIECSARMQVPFIELHTGTYCDSKGSEKERESERLFEAASRAHTLGLNVNAGHGINLDNIDGILAIPHLNTLNIGHSIVARAVFVGLESAVKEMLSRMENYAATSDGSIKKT